MKHVWVIESRRTYMKESFTPDFVVHRLGGEWMRDYAIRAKQIAIDKNRAPNFRYRAVRYVPPEEK